MGVDIIGEERLKKLPGVKQARQKVAEFCSYQERSRQEVRRKLASYGVPDGETEKILAELIAEGFIDEERFAKIYAGGKFRIKKWGRIKISNGLMQHDIPNHCIEAAFSEISDEEYTLTAKNLIENKKELLNKPLTPVIQKKIAHYMIGKGFESALVWEIIKKLS